MAKGMLQADQELVEQRAEVPVTPGDRGRDNYSHVFLWKKPSGKFRLIIILKPLNKRIWYRRFRMDCVYSLS